MMLSIIKIVFIFTFSVTDILQISAIKYGQPASINDYPSLASLERKSETKGKIPCTSSVIDKNWLITAAHCVYEFDGTRISPENIIAYVGSERLFEGTPYNIEKIVVYFDYDYLDDEKFNNDIALLKTVKNIPKKYHAHLPSSKHPYQLYNKAVEALGWGFNERNVTSTILLKGQITIGNCTNQYDQDGTKLCSTKLVEGQPQISVGDSGGPIMYFDGKKNVHVGHLGGIRDNSAVNKDDYMVYYNTSAYLNWIKSVTRKN